MTAAVLDHVRVTEDSEEHASCEAGDAVRVHDPEGIVHLRERPYSREVVPGHPDDSGGDKANVNGAPAVDPARARCDRDQAAEHAVDAAEECWFLRFGEPAIKGHPSQDADCCGEVGVDHGRSHARPGVVRVSTVEAVPAEPQDASPDSRHDQVVGYGVGSVPQQPGSEDPGSHEARDTGRHVDDVATGEVERALLSQVAATPQHERVDAVDEGRPQRHEEAPGAELDTAQHTSEEQKGRDGSEDELEVGKRRGREVEGDGGVSRRHRLALLTDAIGNAAWFADEVLEKVFHPPDSGELGLYSVPHSSTDRGGTKAHLV
jgi:hypothetical protein